MTNSEKNKGFTIMEILIVISIIIILPAIMISNFPQIKKQFAVTRVTYKFSQDLREAQNMALSSAPYKDSLGIVRPVSGYGIYIDIGALGNKRYIMYADNSEQTANQQYDILDYTVKTFDLDLTEPDVIIKEINNVYGNRVSINFSPPDPDTMITELNEGQNRVDIIFAMEAGSEQTRTVSINESGLIKTE